MGGSGHWERWKTARLRGYVGSQDTIADVPPSGMVGDNTHRQPKRRTVMRWERCSCKTQC